MHGTVRRIQENATFQLAELARGVQVLVKQLKPRREESLTKEKVVITNDG
jgi:hypothetical protein